MTAAHEHDKFDPRDARRDSLQGQIMEDVQTGGGNRSAPAPLPRTRSTSEMSDGWIDAGVETANATTSNTNPTATEDISSSLMHNTRDGNLPSASSPPAAPLKPQHTNNPFLRRESSGHAGELRPSHTGQSHEAAWAEFLPEGQSWSAHQPNGPTSADMVTTAPNTIPESTGPMSQVAPEIKGKEPALDWMGMPNRQESGTVAAPSSSTLPNSAAPLEETYPPPPGPPPKKYRNETYQIKHVRWLDYGHGEETRATPILMQNLNGPCPLLALVNALTMSTPRNRESSLVEALRTREQVSLGLLLDAVVEELIANRMSPHAELPDMTELYDFLLALHTGMNVNPAFVSSRQVQNLIDLEPDTPTLPEPKAPGGFEATKESRLYSTFTIPLIHGWLPPPSHPVHAALERSARTHEDAENLLTREEELGEKSAKTGLSLEEQQLLEDITNIKYFLNSSATQLTGYGLDTITETMPTGGFAILFRNNHFSTLHKHPLTGNVFSLVTDMGYIKYPEIIWESLVDVNGLGAELYSGDFRVVSHGPNAPITGTDEFSNDNPSQEWSTIHRSGKGKQTTRNQEDTNEGPSTSHDEARSREQEDADLALALQLQEEEDERHRRENPSPRAPSSRDRTSQNQQWTVNQRMGSATTNRPLVGRRVVNNTHHSPQSNNTASRSNNVIRPARGAQPNNSPFANTSTNVTRPRPPTVTTVRPSDPDALDAPPPTYESALQEQPYHPPQDLQHHDLSAVTSQTTPQTNSEGTPINFNALMQSAERDQALQRQREHQSSTTQTSAYSPMASHGVGMSSAYGEGARRRRGSTNTKDRDRDCIVM